MPLDPAAESGARERFDEDLSEVEAYRASLYEESQEALELPQVARDTPRDMLRPDGPSFGEEPRFKGYEVLEEISRGSTSIVVRGREEATRRIVALKYLRREAASPENLERFRDEAAALQALAHPNIVRISDHDAGGDSPYFAMDLVVGRDLCSLVAAAMAAGAPPPWPDIVRPLIGIATALIHCHEAGILHRDVKPHNILIDAKTRQATLIDFGLMKLTPAQGSAIDPSADFKEDMIGTPAFMSPEQFRPGYQGIHIGPHSDVWGFGATLFFCLTGAPPFNESSILAIYQAMMSRPAPVPSERLASIPHWLDTLCHDCLQRDPALRPSMRLVKARLRRNLDHSERPSRRHFASSTS